MPERDYKKEYTRDQKKRKRYRAKLRKERVKRGLTKSDGYKTSKGAGKDISHAKKGGKGKTRVEASSKNRSRNYKSKRSS
jgi:hypothetical protein